MDLSCAKISLSLLILCISCTLHASSLAILSCSRFSIASKNFFCSSSCFSITSFISLSKKSFHLRFLLRLLSNVSSEEVELEKVSVGKESGGVGFDGGGKLVGFDGG